MPDGIVGETIQDTAQVPESSIQKIEEVDGREAFNTEVGDSGGSGSSSLRTEIFDAERSFDLYKPLPGSSTGGDEKVTGEVTASPPNIFTDKAFFDSPEARAKVLQDADTRSTEYWHAVREDGVKA